ncbi:MAG TPA: chromosome segregation protein SMC, partial [Micromonosporaceae bacterium]|nr:chromosome segregation protein SMC [Micromonosporaceae bacterium]
DNADNALPIEYTEVSITRRMFRSGESEYEINGDPCRLLDIQDLLSDSGIGREMHVIVGQGQLEAVLVAKPEDRRAFIEEAAGVLKHRKRKEKALRKLEAMQANLNRLNDLTAELRRQLKPLGRQAEVARRASAIQAELRDARLRLLADDLSTLRDTLTKEIADETALRAHREQVESGLARVSAHLAELERAHSADQPVLTRAQQTWYELSSLQERFRSTEQLALERARHLATTEEERPGRDPDQLDAEAQEIREQEAALREALAADEARLTEAVAGRQTLEEELGDAERALVTAHKAVADQREGLAKLTGQVDAARTLAQAAEDEIARHTEALDEARARAEAAEEQFEAAQADAEDLSAADVDLDEKHGAAVDALEHATARANELGDAERSTDREASQWRAREEALALGLRRKDGAGALLADTGRVPGLLGSVAALLAVDAGYEAALAAALGGLADAVAVTDLRGATDAMRLLKTRDAGRAELLVGGDGDAPPRPEVTLPDGVRWALDVVRTTEALRPALNHALDRVVFCADLDTARDLVDAHPALRAVTREGDVLGAYAAAGGSAKAQSFIEVQAAVDEARQRRTENEAALETLRVQLEAARDEVTEREAAVADADRARREADTARNAAARKLAALGAAARSARAEAERLAAAREKAEAACAEGLANLTELEERLLAVEAVPLDADPSSDERDRLAALVPGARQNEMEVRLAVRTAEERVGALTGRADGLARQAAAERAARERAATRRQARARGAAISRVVAAGASAALTRIERTLVTAAGFRDEIAATRSAREAELAEIRGESARLAADLERLTSAVHRDEMARTEQRLRLDQLEAKAAEDFGLDVPTLLEEYGPDALVPPTVPEVYAAEEAGRPMPPALPYDRAIQEKRSAKAERELTLLGKVNPLALEEFAALEERYKFLSDQLEDLKATRRDLLIVVKDVDERILEIFSSAFEDTAREFEQVFAVLFPGGEGRLVLTDPEDMLATGVEVEARPPGKKIKRLSLLSGGEKSLTAVALLVAIFRARPSPFYIMDEVEAALDDVNLGRLLMLMRQLRTHSQLIIVTHQKRTMEIADALYGVTMRGGITEVISQRLQHDDAEEAEREPVGGLA